MTDQQLIPVMDNHTLRDDHEGGQEQNDTDNAAPVIQQQPQQQENMWSVFKKIAYRMIIFYLMSNLIRGFFQPSSINPASNATRSTTVKETPSRNLYQFMEHLDFYVYLSESSEKFDRFDDPQSFFWHVENFRYGDWYSGDNKDGCLSKTLSFEPSDTLKNNGSIYLHVFMTKAGFQPDPNKKSTYSTKFTYYKMHRLNKYRKKRYQKTTNLLTGKSEQSEEDFKKADIMSAEILSHWHPNLTLNVITDQTNWVPGSVPPPLDEYVDFDESTKLFYYPPLYFNDYWNLAAEYHPINQTINSLNVTLTIAPISLFKWQLYAAQNMRGRWSKMLGSSSALSSLFEDDDQQDDQDSLKQAMLDTNPYLLGLTIIVSILHTIFEFLAFKNDIQFWRNKKSLEGLSVKSVVFNLVTSIIVLLYILDNETSFVIRCSVGIGVLIELWKIPKCMDVSVNREKKLLGIIPTINIKDKGSYVESSTKIYDNLAFKYLSWLLYPLILCYAVYSLMYQEHRGWYSWILSMLYGFLLTFGFIMMTPQLFINYKMKSVAHLPWRMLTYKFLNTFIDDIFAFVIKMPTMYRIGCFRDDIVFLIYLYQRWIYRVDPKRMNEFGVSGEELENISAAISAGGEVDRGEVSEQTESKKDK